MQQITLRLPDDMLDDIEDEAEEHDTSRSEHIRDVLESRNEHAGMRDETRREYEREIEELESELESLRNQQVTAMERYNKRRDGDIEVLKEFVREEKERRDASYWQRWKWKYLGRDEDDKA